MARKRIATDTPAPIAEPVLLTADETAPDSLLDEASETAITDAQAPVDASQESAGDTMESDELPDAPVDPRLAKIQEMETRRAILTEELSAIQRERHALQQREAELGREIDLLTGRIDPLLKQESEADGILAYIRKQNEVREQKALRVQSLLTAGVDPSELRKPMSAIDAALARNRKRGGQRPDYPKVG